MSILHDSLQRFERSGAASSAPWTLTNALGKRQGRGLLSPKSWTLLAALGILSLAAWAAVTLWPVPSTHSGGIVSELPVHSPASSPAPQRNAVSVQPQESSRPVMQQRYVPPENISSRPNAKPQDNLDQRALAELNTQLATLLEILAAPGTRDQGTSEQPLELMELHDGEPGTSGEWASHYGETAPRGLTSQPEVHVSVSATKADRTDRVDLEAIRRVEERLGQALRDRNWQVFDLEYQRLENLKPHARDGMAQWQAARAIASGDFPEAQRILENLRLANPRDLQTGLNLALVYEAQGRIASAREVGAELARTHPLEPRVQTLLDRLENRPRR